MRNDFALIIITTPSCLKTLDIFYVKHRLYITSYKQTTDGCKKIYVIVITIIIKSDLALGHETVVWAIFY